MIGVDLGARTVDDALRLVRALGAHRYVAGRMHLVHALAFEAAGEGAEGLADAHAWAAATLREPAIDASSRDEALWRRSSEAEVAAVLETFWRPGPRARAARDALRRRLRALELPERSGPPFDESREAEAHPLLVDAGWELLPLADLEPERHRGAIAAFDAPLAYASARFEEETAIPPPVTLCELPAMGALELLEAADDEGVLREPLVVWVAGHETYLDYVLRGVRRAAKLPDEDNG